MTAVAAKKRRHWSTYLVWMGIIQRCTNPKIRGWPYYGGRGIKVCVRWRSFKNFLADMGERPPGLSIDRIDNDGNYEPLNCRWATPEQQARNNRMAKPITAFGKTMTIIEWSAERGIKPWALYARLAKGWDVARALTEPVRYRSPRKKTGEVPFSDEEKAEIEAGELAT